MRRLLALVALAAPAAFPQLFTAGFKAGVPLTDAFKTGTGALGNFTSENRRYTIGPTIEMNLPFGLGIEFDALYKRLGYEETITDSGLHRAITADAWDFPVLLKVKTGMQPIRPYFVLGPTFRGVTRLKQAGDFFDGNTGGDPPELERNFNAGFTAGVGLRLGARVAFSPEMRYTRWGWQTFRSTAGLLHSNNDQVELLIGLTF